MASTSTNKQPLLIDRPLHNAYTLGSQKTGSEGYWLSGNSCQLVVDCSQNDGALIEDVYAVLKTADPVNISLFMGGSSVDLIRENDPSTVFLGRFAASGAAGDIVHFGKMPVMLAPNPTSIPADIATGGATPGDGTQKPVAMFQGLYIPRGRTLWAGLAVTSTEANLNNDVAPTLGVSGGYY